MKHYKKHIIQAFNYDRGLEVWTILLDLIYLIIIEFLFN